MREIGEVVKVDPALGTTPCEYAAKCTDETDELVKFPWGYIPVCKRHQRFMATH